MTSHFEGPSEVQIPFASDANDGLRANEARRRFLHHQVPATATADQIQEEIASRTQALRENTGRARLGVAPIRVEVPEHAQMGSDDALCNLVYDARHNGEDFASCPRIASLHYEAETP